MFTLSRFGLVVAAFAFSSSLPAQNAPQDAPPVDARNMLQSLKGISEQQTASTKTAKQRAFQEATAAASNPARAAELWEEAVRITQFQGLKESAPFREWREGEGRALKEKEVQGALRLYFDWLALSLQKSSGVPNKELFNAVLAHAQAAAADEGMMDVFNDELKREQEVVKEAGRKGASEHAKREKSQDEAVKKLHDSILNGGLAGSIYVQAMRLSEELAEVAPAKRNGKGAPAADEGGNRWEANPANAEGMYQNILLPELRARRDLRAVEYWEWKLRRETEKASRQRLAFEVEKFNSQRRPQLLWSRAQEFNLLGLKNKAATEMFSIIKNFPNHGDAAGWIAELTTLLAPPPPTAPSAPTAVPAPASP